MLLETVSDDALDSIAAADYGFGQQASHKALEDMRLTGLVPAPMDSMLHEVAERRAPDLHGVTLELRILWES